MEADLKRTAEALLFAAPEPLSLNRMQAIIPRCERRALREALAELARQYDEGGHAFQLVEIGGGWRIVTRPEHARRIEELLKGQRKVRLSRAALECVAVVAYRQPCTRVDVEAVRGVNSGGSLATLLERGMIRITGRAETLGRPLLYGTTDAFLSHLGINDLADLPQLTEIEALLATPAEEEKDSSPVPGEERRERLVANMENISDLIAESAVIESEVRSEGGNGNGNGASETEPEALEEVAPESIEESAHAAILQAGREEEMEVLTETAESEVAEEAAAAATANQEGTLELIARALEDPIVKDPMVTDTAPAAVTAEAEDNVDEPSP